MLTLPVGCPCLASPKVHIISTFLKRVSAHLTGASVVISHAASRYSPAEVVKAEKIVVVESHDQIKICTSHIEKQNHTLRMHCRRLTLLTSAFSKKLENFKAAIGLNMAYYNSCKVHRAICATPAMEIGIEPSAVKSSMVKPFGKVGMELFSLSNHPKAKRCYAWSNPDP